MLLVIFRKLLAETVNSNFKSSNISSFSSDSFLKHYYCIINSVTIIVSSLNYWTILHKVWLEHLNIKLGTL